MRFERLRLAGFKSFVEPTELVIRDGLTGIVGPNGCGKSNLLEALRWVMGESSAKALRGTGAAAGGGGMEDVIFAGTDRRPSRNIAEVTLVLDNRARRAPAAFNGEDRLEVMRRIERGAGSDYSVNAREVRQRDVQLLFADAATGAQSPALVSQGRVAAIIAARPEERRSLLEDAAGIGGLGVRRREAEIRLKAADSNLARLADLMAASETQAASLKRQARAARRYRELSAAIRQAEAAALLLAHGDALARLEAARAREQTALAELAEATGAEAQSRTAQASAAAALPGKRPAEAEAAARLQALLTARATLLAERQAAVQRRQDLAAALAAAGDEEARAAARRTDLQATRARLVAERAAASAAAAEAAEAEGPAAAQVSGQEMRAGVAERALAASVEAHAGLLADARAVRAAADAADSRLRRLETERDRQAAELARLDQAGAGEAARRALAEVEAQAAAMAVASEEASAALLAAEAVRRAAEESRARAVQALALSRAEVQGLEAEVDALRRLQVSPDRRSVRLALEAASGAEAALAAALGDDAAAAAGPAPGDAPPARRWLGAVSRGDDPPLPEGVEPLAPLVRVPAELDRRLAQVGLVADAPSPALLEALRPGQRLVSRAGWMWRWDGFVAPPGGTAGAVAEAMRQASRLAELVAGLESPRARASANEAEVERQKRVLAEADAAERTALAARAEAVRAREQALARLEGLRNTLSAAEARRAAVAASIERLAAECEGAAGELDAARARVAALPDSSEAAEAVGEARRVAERARADLARMRADLAGLVRGKAESSARLQALDREIAGWEAREREEQAAEEALASRIGGLRKEHEALLGRPEAMAAEIEALEAEVAGAETARGTAGEAVVSAELELAGLDQAVRACAARVADLREARAIAAAAGAAATERLEAVLAEAAERFGGLPEPRSEDAGLAHGAGRLEALRAERDRLGAVNLVAEEELAALEEALARHAAEKAELETAIARLRGSVGALNREGRARLLEAFRLVDGHFRDLFLTLFGGGKAELALVDSDDPLEAGLEIRAQPPGKRLQSLALLSGGEQALTAIALIFALFRARPAPICVLDEVDAPLDDANVERFCRLLETMAETTDTRFLVVTHNMISMAAMHRLYGVTMAEPGVSQLVSVVLSEAQALAA